jgi:hypothetical protein
MHLKVVSAIIFFFLANMNLKIIKMRDEDSKM